MRVASEIQGDDSHVKSSHSYKHVEVNEKDLTENLDRGKNIDLEGVALKRRLICLHLYQIELACYMEEAQWKRLQ